MSFCQCCEGRDALSAVPQGTLQNVLQAFGEGVQVVGELYMLKWWQVARLDLEHQTPKGGYSTHLHMNPKAGWSVTGCRGMMWRAGMYQETVSDVAG